MKEYELIKKIKKTIGNLYNVEPNDVVVNNVDISDFSNSITVWYTYMSSMLEFTDGKKIVDINTL